MRPPRIVVVGSFLVDVCACVSDLAAEGTITALESSIVCGGKSLNQAVALRRLGCDVVTVGAIGNDPFGIFVKDCLHKEGIAATDLRTVAGSHTGVGFPMRDNAGRNRIVVCPGAAFEVSGADVREAIRHLSSVDGIALCLEAGASALEACIVEGHRLACPVFANAAPNPEIAPESIWRASYVIVNTDEASITLRRSVRSIDDCIRAAHDIKTRGCKVAIVTCGGEGAVAVSDKELVVSKSFPVNVADVTGAGDAFCAGLAFSALNREPLEASIRFATACGALACQAVGSSVSMPTIGQVMVLLQQYSV